jgi:hypothetical protein
MLVRKDNPTHSSEAMDRQLSLVVPCLIARSKGREKPVHSNGAITVQRATISAAVDHVVGLQTQWAEELRLRNAELVKFEPLADRKARVNRDDDLACMLCELEGGDAEVECTALRNEVFQWVFDQSRFELRAKYRQHRERMAELEGEIETAKFDLMLEQQNLVLMLPEPHKPRRIKNTNRYVRDADGIRVPRSK